MGKRVGAVMKATDTEVYLFGYGEHVGDEIPPPEITLMGISLHELGHKNPKIVLDDGKVVWGCECWWGAEEKVRAMVGDRKVVLADIEEERKKAKEPGP